MECQVCVEPYSKKRTKVHCSCGLDVCISCAKRYILDRLELPHCMSCKNRWTKQFLYDNFKYPFVKFYLIPINLLPTFPHYRGM